LLRAPFARIRNRPAAWLMTVDLAGTFVFAVQGAMTAIAAEFDLWGVKVLAIAPALWSPFGASAWRRPCHAAA
jgi:Glycine transporter